MPGAAQYALLDEGDPVLTDFGLAKQVADPAMGITREGQIIGTDGACADLTLTNAVFSSATLMCKADPEECLAVNKIIKPIKEVGFKWEVGPWDFGPFGKLGPFGIDFYPFGFIKTIDTLCIPYKDIKDCRSEQDLADLAALLGCSFDDKNLWKRCYYERVKSICLADDEMINGYKDLFEGPTASELQAQFNEIVGGSTSTNASGTGISISGSGTGIGIQNQGGNGGHNHGMSVNSLDMRVQFVDVIFAQRD